MCPWVSNVLLLNNNVNAMSFKRNYCTGGSLLGKQYSHLIQDVQDYVGTGPGAPGPDGGRHRPIAAMYLAAAPSESWITSLFLLQETLHVRRQYSSFPTTSDVTPSRIAPVFEDSTS